MRPVRLRRIQNIVLGREALDDVGEDREARRVEGRAPGLALLRGRHGCSTTVVFCRAASKVNEARGGKGARASIAGSSKLSEMRSRPHVNTSTAAFDAASGSDGKPSSLSSRSRQAQYKHPASARLRYERGAQRRHEARAERALDHRRDVVAPHADGRYDPRRVDDLPPLIVFILTYFERLGGVDQRLQDVLRDKRLPLTPKTRLPRRAACCAKAFSKDRSSVSNAPLSWARARRAPRADGVATLVVE